MSEAAAATAPEPEQLVHVRGRTWVVSDVSASALPGRMGPDGMAERLVTLTSVEDDRYDEQVQVLWGLEPGARVLERATMPRLDPDRLDDPERLAAFLDAVRWGAVTSADSMALQAPFRSGIAIEDYQLRPGGAGAAHARGQPADPRRRGVGQDDRGGAGGPGAVASPSGQERAGPVRRVGSAVLVADRLADVARRRGQLMAISKVTYKSGKTAWRVRVQRNGKTVESATFTTLREAKEFDAARRTQVHHPDWIDPSAGRIPVADIAEQWLAARRNVAPLTLATDRGLYRRLIEPAFGKRAVAKVTPADVSGWLGELAGRQVAPATRRRALAVLRGIFAHAVADQRIRTSPTVGVKGPRGGARREGQALTDEQLGRLLAELPEHCRPPLIALATTGMRISELCGLRVADVMNTPYGLGLRAHRSISQSPEGGKAVIGDMKSHRARLIPVPKILEPWVRRRIEDAPPEAPLFPAPEGGHWTRGNFAKRSGWYEARVRAGLPTVRIHDLRHTAATTMLTESADVLSVSRVLGHSTPTLTLSLYGHVIDRGIFDAVARTDRRLTAEPVSEGPSADESAR
jgi:integrase